MSSTPTPPIAEHSNPTAQRQSCCAYRPACAGDASSTQAHDTDIAASHPQPARGFTALPNAVLLNTHLTRDARLLYALLLHHARQTGRCYPSHATLAAELGASETMVRTYLRALTAAGLITTRRRGQGRTNLYMLRPVGATAAEAGTSSRPTTVADPASVSAPRADSSDAGVVRALHVAKSAEAALPEPQQTASEEDRAEQDIVNAAARDRLERASYRVPAEQDRRCRVPHALAAGTEPSAGPRPEPRAAAGEPTPPVSAPVQFHVLPAVRAAIGALRRELGDQASFGATLARATNLLHSAALPVPTFLALLEEARRLTLARTDHIQARCVGADGAPRRNLLPYCFAVLEDRLRQVAALPRPSALPPPGAGGGDAATSDPQDQTATRPPVDIESHPLWGRLLADLRETLAPAAYARCCTGRVTACHDHLLEITVPDPLTRAWFETRLRPRIEQLLCRLGHEQVRLTFTVPAPGVGAAACAEYGAAAPRGAISERVTPRAIRESETTADVPAVPRAGLLPVASLTR
jgi:hypothetical protein